VSADVRHEPADVRARPALVAAGAFVALIVLAGLVQVLLLGQWSVRVAVTPGATPPLPPQERREPPEPRLLSRPRGALDALRAEEHALLDEYAWVNREAGIVRIPVERAIELLAGPEKAPRR
jgi:hypothetical protein